MKLKKVYGALAITVALSVTASNGLYVGNEGAHTPRVYAAEAEETESALKSSRPAAKVLFTEHKSREAVTKASENGSVTDPSTELGSESVTEPATESESEPMTESTIESGSESVTEPATESESESVTESATESGSESVTEPATESGSESMTELITESESESLTEPATEPGSESVAVEPVESESESETEDFTEPGSEPVTDASTETGTETPFTEPGSEFGTEPSTEMEKNTHEPETESAIENTESQTEEESKSSDEEDVKDKDEQNTQTLTNSELISLQKIVVPPAIEESFRFLTVEKDYAIANVAKLQIYEKKDTGSDVVGTLGNGGICYVLNGQDPSWYYVESGVVRGFVRISDILTGTEADTYVAKMGETNLAVATASKEPMANSSFTYTKTTVRNTVVGKQFALSNGDGVNVREGRDESSRVIGVMNQDTLCFILADANCDWVFVESGNVRGFVKGSFLSSGDEVKKRVLESGETLFPTAEEKISPKENKACYYTITSIKKGSVSDSIRESMLKYAMQFVGNAYVWGGTSLTGGADCSGFVQSIYAAYGYQLPRVAQAQAQYGMQIPVTEAKPGDLIFYAKDGQVYHVVLYLGDGKTIESANSSQGIICSVVDTGHAVWATRIISDSDSDKIEQVNENADRGVAYTKAKAGDSGACLGRFKLTAYCSCSVCCGQWSGGPTAGGTIPVQGRTIAMAGVPFGTKLVIGGMIYTVEDRGTPYGHVDIYMNSHTDAQNFGVQYADVYLAN